MFVRVTHYTMRPDAMEGAKLKLEALRERMMSMPGMLQFVNGINEDGAGVAIAINESEEKANANADAVRGLWAEFQDDLSSAPDPRGFTVDKNWLK